MKSNYSFAKIAEMNSRHAVNKHLDLGWELIDVCTRLFGEGLEDRKEGDEYFRYVLGWPRGRGDAQHPNIPDLNGIDV